jgi:hypothetical protein
MIETQPGWVWSQQRRKVLKMLQRQTTFQVSVRQTAEEVHSISLLHMARHEQIQTEELE